MKSLIRASMIQPEDLLDKIYKAWIAHKTDQLPEDERKVLERMEYADSKLREGGEASRYKKLVEDMLQMFKEHNVTRRTIENDIARAKRFFLSVRSREDKEYARGKSIEWLERLIWKAEDAGDYRAAAAFIKELNEIQGLKKDDPNLPDYTKVERQPILVVSDPQQINLPVIPNLEEELRKLRMAKTAFLKDDQDIEDAEIIEEEDDE